MEGYDYKLSKALFIKRYKVKIVFHVKNVKFIFAVMEQKCEYNLVAGVWFVITLL